jgi:CubicO group peptidase (beta-lactamase class C family)
MKALSYLTRWAAAPLAGLALTAQLAAQPLATEPPVDPATAQARVAMMFRELEAAGFTGVAALSLDGETVFIGGSGVADPATGRAFDAQTQVDVGSITKSFTGMLAAQLIADGTLAADTRLDAVFEDVPRDKAGITLHQMLTHAAGFPGAVGDDLADDDFETFWAAAMQAELRFEPGTGYHYSNVGFALAAAMMERATGDDFETLLRTRLAAVGLDATGYDTAYRPDTAVHLPDGRDVRAASWGGHPPNWHLIGNGGLVSTAADMLAWRHAYASGQLVSPQARDLAQTPHRLEGRGAVSHYGYGLVVEDDPRLGRIYWHNGGNPHFNAHWRDLSDHGLVLFVAANQRRINADAAVDALTAAWFDQPHTLRPRDMTAADPVALPDTPEGQLARAFIDVLAADDDASIAAFVRDHMTDQLQAWAPMEDHVRMFQTLRADLGGQPVTGFSVADQAVELTIHAPAMGGPVPVRLDLDPDAPGRIAGLSIG